MVRFCKLNHYRQYPSHALLYAVAYTVAVLSSNQRVQTEAEIARLEESRKECYDAGISRVIDSWIEELRLRLSNDSRKDS